MTRQSSGTAPALQDDLSVAHDPHISRDVKSSTMALLQRITPQGVAGARHSPRAVAVRPLAATRVTGRSLGATSRLNGAARPAALPSLAPKPARSATVVCNAAASGAAATPAKPFKW